MPVFQTQKYITWWKHLQYTLANPIPKGGLKYIKEETGSSAHNS